MLCAERGNAQLCSTRARSQGSVKPDEDGLRLADTPHICLAPEQGIHTLLGWDRQGEDRRLGRGSPLRTPDDRTPDGLREFGCHFVVDKSGGCVLCSSGVSPEAGVQRSRLSASLPLPSFGLGGLPNPLTYMKPGASWWLRGSGTGHGPK